MAWFIQTNFKNAAGEKVERTERIPAHNNVTDELTVAFRNILFQMLAEAADDESDLSLTVAYLGERTAQPSLQTQRRAAARPKV